MSESARLLKGIMKTSGWTQEQLATKLGVSYPTMNAWVNGKSQPRQTMMERIRRLYLAQDITDDVEPTYVTLVNVSRRLKVGDLVILEKDFSNDYDDEAILAMMMDDDRDVWLEEDAATGDDGGSDDEVDGGGGDSANKDDGIDGDDDWVSEDDLRDDEMFGGKVAPIEVEDNSKTYCLVDDYMYVANSISTVVRGTSSAGRIYDKFEKTARARVLFVFHKTAVARVVEWNYAKKGE